MGTFNVALTSTEIFLLSPEVIESPLCSVQVKSQISSVEFWLISKDGAFLFKYRKVFGRVKFQFEAVKCGFASSNLHWKGRCQCSIWCLLYGGTEFSFCDHLDNYIALFSGFFFCLALETGHMKGYRDESVRLPLVHLVYLIRTLNLAFLIPFVMLL